MVDRQDDLRWVLHLVPEPIVQTRLSGREFTIDVLVDRQGDLAGAVPRWRLETRAGISTRGRTFEDKDLVDLAGELLAAAGLRGPANVQGFMAADGTPSFIEVNPRFSGGLPLSIAAGADLVGEFVRGVLGEPVRAERLTYQPGVTMIRHFEELFE
jgi:carbamoyl-phosphate synthase large subunit